MNSIKRVVSEPSSWAGLAGILQGLKLLAPAYAPLIDGLSIVVGAVAVAMREQGGRNVP